MSQPFRLCDAEAWTGGTIVQGPPETELSGASIDSRRVERGQLFVAIVGPRHDGHDFLDAVAERGAGGLLVSRGSGLPALPTLVVDDTTRGLGALAAGHRAGFDGPVVAITGSNGKTTTKEMCAAILAEGAPTLHNPGNLNNQFGLPLTLLARDPSHRRMVVELGMNHRGEIAALTEIARPTVGVVTNVGTAHIEHLGSREEIAREKGDLLAALPADGVALVNADDDFASDLAGRTRARVVRFGAFAPADIAAQDVRHDREGFDFDLHAPQGRVPVRVAGLGAPTVSNALAAAGAALAAGASLEQVASGLARHRPVWGRLARRELPGGVVLIDDSYNANPQSMEVALRLLAENGDGRRIAVLGDMGELGSDADAAHVAAGRLTAELGIEVLVAVGKRAGRVAEGAATRGMDAERILTLRSSDEAGPVVGALLEQGDRVLLKGSRAMQMERVVEHLDREAREARR